MKIGIIPDMHIGISEHKELFNKYHMKCIDYIYSEFKKLNIEHIIYLGDIFDKRYSISVKTLKQAKDIFNNDFKQYFLLGNHDVTYKNSNELNSVEILLGEKNKVVVNTPEEIHLGNKKFLLVPWINKTNIEKVTEIINDSTAEYLLGHLDLNGFEMIRGIVSSNGQFKLSLLKKFIHVISGHFHCFSQRKNITYLGSVSEMTWNDHNVKKYAGYLETDTDEFNTIEIPYSIYKVIRIKSNKDIQDINLFKDKIVKVYLYIKRTIKIEDFISKLIDVCMSVTVIDEEVINATLNLNLNEQNMSILELWKSYLNEMEITKKDSMICDRIFNESYLKVTGGNLT